MKKGNVDIVVLLDKSTSMLDVFYEAVDGFNAFIEEQKKIGRGTVTLALFNNKYKELYTRKDLGSVEPLRYDTYVPSGTTSLFDAVGRAIKDVGIRLANAAEEQRPEQVIFVIIADGPDNSSVRFLNKDIRPAIWHQADNYAWKFMFFSPKQVQKVGAAMGIINCYDYDFSSTGISALFRRLNAEVNKIRGIK